MHGQDRASALVEAHGVNLVAAKPIIGKFSEVGLCQNGYGNIQRTARQLGQLLQVAAARRQADPLAAQHAFFSFFKIDRCKLGQGGPIGSARGGLDCLPVAKVQNGAQALGLGLGVPQVRGVKRSPNLLAVDVGAQDESFATLEDATCGGFNSGFFCHLSFLVSGF